MKKKNLVHFFNQWNPLNQSFKLKMPKALHSVLSLKNIGGTKMWFLLYVPSVLVCYTLAGSINDIEHIVIFMQENRAFDHYYGNRAAFLVS